jgi:cytochrome c oxidase subunit 4
MADSTKDTATEDIATGDTVAHTPLHVDTGPSLQTYYRVYGALLLLLFLTVAVAEIHLGVFGIFVAILIAVAKALLVALNFMHLRFNSRLTWVFAGAGFVWLAILFTTVFDYLSRSWVGQ